MLTTKDFEKRANQLFESCRDRWKKKLQKGLPKGVILDIAPEAVLPFTRRQFQAWLWKQTGLGAFSCIYCRAAIDIVSCQLDHKTPLRRGGGPELDNLQVICKRCNQVKGELSHEEYSILVAFFDGPGASFRQRIEGTLINGGVGKMMRIFPGRDKTKKKHPTKVQDSLEFSEFGEF